MTDQPAFPHLNPNYDGNWDKNPQRGGMSYRQWLAGLAMQGLAEKAFSVIPHGVAYQTLAAESVRIADALIAELSKEGA